MTLQEAIKDNKRRYDLAVTDATKEYYASIVRYLEQLAAMIGEGGAA